MVLARGGWRPTAVDRVTLARCPERRRLLLVRLQAGGRGAGDRARLGVACTHLSVPSTGRGAAELRSAAEHAAAFAGADPLLLGGDLNLRPANASAAFEAGHERHGLAGATGPRALDHLLVRGLDTIESPRALPPARREIAGAGGSTLRLSDHAPVVASFGVR
jgi:endonuclease/exonuclease/phosphatase family metal-dependent hydrolase